MLGGSQYPFDMGIAHPLALISEAKLAEKDQENILYRTAEDFLGIASGPQVAFQDVVEASEVLRKQA